MYKFAKYEALNTAILSIPAVIKASGFAGTKSVNSFMRMIERAMIWILLKRKEFNLISSGYHTSFNTRAILELTKTSFIGIPREQIMLTKSYCQCCGQKAGLEIDHVVPLRYGGNNSTENTQVLCGVCHSEKGLDIIQFQQGKEFFFSGFSSVPKSIVRTYLSSFFSRTDTEKIRNSLGLNIYGLYDTPLVMYFAGFNFTFSIDYPRKEQVVPEVYNEASIDWLSIFDSVVEFIPSQADQYDLFINKVFSEQDRWTTKDIRQRSFDEGICLSKDDFGKLYNRLTKLCNNINMSWTLKERPPRPPTPTQLEFEDSPPKTGNP